MKLLIVLFAFLNLANAQYYTQVEAYYQEVVIPAL